MTEPAFENLVSTIASTEDDLAADLRADLQAEGSTIANLSPFSPFFRLLTAIFSKPLLVLRALVLDSLLPGIFPSKATGALLDIHAAGMDDARKPASKAVGNITFFRAGSAGALAIPSGTVVESPPIAGVVLAVVTTVAGSIPDGFTSAKVAAEAVNEGAAYNLGDGFYSVLPVAVPGVTQVSNEADWLTTPGADIETDADLQTRLRLKWRKQSSFHWTDTYRSIVADLLAIDPDDIFFDETAPRGPGSADIFFITSAGLPSAALVQQADDEINLNKNHGLGDDVLVKAMPALNVDIEITVTAEANASAADKTQLASDVENLLRAAFRENSAHPDVPRVAPFGRVSRSELGGEIHDAFSNAEAVDWIQPAADPLPVLELPVIHRVSMDAAPATDEGGGLVGLPATAHGFATGRKITLAGTVNYDGVHTVDAASTADKIVFAAAFNAEAFTGAETATALVVTVV